MKPQPVPATPAATPMAQPQRALSELEVCIRARAYKHEDRELLQLCNQMRALLQPAAAQPQRESEQPEQALREALERSMVALDDWLNIHASDHCDEQRVKEARQRVNEHGTIHYICAVQDRNRAALSPQTDSQEPR